MRIAAFNALNLGDNLVFLPVIQALRRQFPAAEILVVTNEMATEMYDAASFRVITARKSQDRHVSYWKRPRSFWNLVRQLRSFKPDVTVVAHAQPNAIHIAAALSGAKTRVGGTHDRLARLPLLTHGIPLDHQKNMALQGWDIYALLCKTVGISEIAEAPPRPDLLHLESSISFEGAVIHPGGSQEYRRWGIDNYLHLAQRLADRWPVKFIWEALDAPPPADIRGVEFVSALNLRTLANEIHKARLFIGNNSGPMHLAVALGVPAMVITGPTAKIWDPYWGAEHNVILQDTSLPCLRCEAPLLSFNRCINFEEPIACMRRWTVDKVYGHAEEVLMRDESAAY